MPATRTKSALMLALAAAVAIAIVVVTLRVTNPHAEREDYTHSIAIVASGDTAGWIVPCGCTANQSGGLLRRGTFLRDLREQFDVIAVDAGGAASGPSEYQRLKFAAILRGEGLMQVAAHNLGESELKLGAAEIRAIGRRTAAPWVSANVRDRTGALIAPPVRIVPAGGRRLAIVGVTSPRYQSAEWLIGEPRDEILTAIGAVRGRYDSLIVLAYLPEDELRSLAASLPEADAVIGSSTGQSIAPESAGATVVAAATNKGKFLIDLRPSKSEAWSGRAVELDAQFADDPAQSANVKSYLAELGQRDFPASATGFATPLPSDVPDGYRLAGSDSCRSCHAEESRSWSESHHAHAWKTLETRGYHVDGFCQQCHTTGYGMPGGFETVRDSMSMRNVGCESCHGPSAAHVRQPKVRTPFVARDQCERCHDRENSPHFAYDAFWAKIRHGPPRTAGGGRAP